ncbi:hypothetical protein SAZ_01625 [Streptomyces noursei ZPM]|nr:hypothetical protein SAZ_01625 [Streptomyces noursei ZPM]EOS99272.1 hypothetical protein K530_34748 [Streptomyces noursei CCRC 11814]EXU92336.1 hypothetical protein P354_25970 [Streptomyces noursei PD-1]
MPDEAVGATVRTGVPPMMTEILVRAFALGTGGTAACVARRQSARRPSPRLSTGSRGGFAGGNRPMAALSVRDRRPLVRVRSRWK